MSRSKNYYAVVDKKTGKVRKISERLQIFEVKSLAQHFCPSFKYSIIPIPVDRLNQFIQQYIPVKPVDQVPGN